MKKKNRSIRNLICVIRVLIPVIGIPIAVIGECNAANWRAFHKSETRTGYTREEVVPPLIYKWNSYEKNGKKMGSIVSSPAVVDGKVFIGSQDGKVYAFDAFTGEKIWEFSTRGWINSSPCVYKGVVYVGSRDGKLYALDTSNGTQKWVYSAGGTICSSPIAADDLIYFGVSYPEKKVVCLDANTGAVKWSYATGGYVYSSPAVKNSNLYFGANDGKFYCLVNGKLKWSKETLGSIYYSSVATDEDTVYGLPGDDELYLYAYDLASGEMKWRSGKLATNGPVYVSSIVLGEDKIFVGCGVVPHYIFALRKSDGAILWSQSVGNASASGICSSPALANGVLYVGSADEGDLYALDVSSGTIVWWEDLGSEIVGSPAVSNGWVYIGTTEGILYAYQASEIYSISSPDDGERISGEVPVSAYIVSSSTLTSVNTFQISYGLGEKPNSWISVCSGEASEIQGSKLTTWDTIMLPKGTYTLKLKVNNSKEAQVTVLVDQPEDYFGATFETYVWPNPVYLRRGAITRIRGKIPGTGKVDVEIKIYNLVGELVRTLKDTADNAQEMRGIDAQKQYNFGWNLKNDDGEMVASGVYIYIVYVDGKPQKGKIKKIAVVK